MKPSVRRAALLLGVVVWGSGIVAAPPAARQPETPFAVIGYVHGNMEHVDDYSVESLTHLIYSFLHLNGNRLAMSPRDSLAVAHLIALKSRNPQLKVLVSLGGWGGCAPCSDVFSTAEGRREFAQSALEILRRLHADGLDLDWEYPAIEGYPAHKHALQDRHNFTMLLDELRGALGDSLELSFAAGGFPQCLRESFEWQEVLPLVDRVNIMSYDLVNGNSTRTGHHTPLFSTIKQVESTDNAVSYLDSLGAPSKKIVIGAAFYARVWEGVADSNLGLYQPGRFKAFIPYRLFKDYFADTMGWRYTWDSVAQAPFRYARQKKLFATFDDSASVSGKTRYALSKRLGGIMFWELSGDTPTAGLLESITGALREGRRTTFRPPVSN
jgi:chitinase